MLPHNTTSTLGPWYRRALCWFWDCRWRVVARTHRVLLGPTYRSVNTPPPGCLSVCQRCGTVVNDLPRGIRMTLPEYRSLG